MKTGLISCNLRCGVLGLTMGLMAPFVAMAQDAADLSADEITALFESQRTRGLVLVPLEEEGAATDAIADGTEVAAVDDTYVQIDPGSQVNIRISFGFDSAALTDVEKAKLVNLCQAMLASDIPVFKIIGHTDASGSDTYNQRLSLLRAEEVQRALIGDCGIGPERLEATGVGEAFPFDPNDPRSDTNRRVEFQVSS